MQGTSLFRCTLTPDPEAAYSRVMQNSFNNHMLLGTLGPDSSTANMNFRSEKNDRVLMINISGEIPLPIANSLVLMAEIKSSIEEKICQHFDEFERVTSRRASAGRLSI